MSKVFVEYFEKNLFLISLYFVTYFENSQREIYSNLNGNILTYNESEDAYYIQHGADSVPKKLGEPELTSAILHSGQTYSVNTATSASTSATLSKGIYAIFATARWFSPSSLVGGENSFSITKSKSNTTVTKKTSGVYLVNIQDDSDVIKATASGNYCLTINMFVLPL